MTPSEILNLVLGAVAVIVLAVLAWTWVRSRTHRPAPPQEPYTLALSALISGDRREALRRLKEAVEADSENLDAYIRMGDLLREGGQVKKALAVHRDLTVRPHLTDADRVRILESLTRDYLVAGRFEEAGQAAERLLRVDRRNLFAFQALQEVAEALKDWPRAIDVVTKAAKIHPKMDKRYLSRYLGYVATRELEEGQTKEAAAHLKEALKLDPECLLAHLFLGDMEEEAGHLEKAVEHWRTLALQAPERASLVFDRLERAYFEQGQFGEVIPFYRELLHRSPREVSVPALLALAEIHRRKGELDEAETFVQEALDVEPEHPRAHRELVKLALDREDSRAALERVNQLLSALHETETAGDCRFCGAPLDRPAFRCPRCQAFDPLGL